jgi:inosine/xanthosine triphosphate pyrophosphatase family protein
MQLCFATNNTHKLEEIRAILGENFVLKDPPRNRV